jgi:hypothetical protein
MSYVLWDKVKAFETLDVRKMVFSIHRMMIWSLCWSQ